MTQNREAAPENALSAFLLARIADRDLFWELVGKSAQAHPDRVKVYRAECEALRHIVSRGLSECSGYADQAEFESHHYPDPEWQFCDGCSAAASADSDWVSTLRTLALPYADHPDYRSEWSA